MKILTMSRDEHKHAFFCPGCGFAHWFKTDGNGWTWNGDRDKPTISPSILTLGVEPRCHSFVTDGRIRFLDDCTHKLKGQTVELPEFPGPSNATGRPDERSEDSRQRGVGGFVCRNCSQWIGSGDPNATATRGQCGHGMHETKPDHTCASYTANNSMKRGE